MWVFSLYVGSSAGGSAEPAAPGRRSESVDSVILSGRAGRMGHSVRTVHTGDHRTDYT